MKKKNMAAIMAEASKPRSTAISLKDFIGESKTDARKPTDKKQGQ
jgi:hypothetical protein